ncbi:MAG: hypothetical protein MZV65_46050 [Chromatiales bacterium]|nr:hypothetical protein [Chromatiales bacterium]
MLGIAELLAALQAEQAGFGGNTDKSLMGMLALVWCKNEADRLCLQRIWEDLQQDKAESPLTSRGLGKSSAGAEGADQTGATATAFENKPTVTQASGESFGVVPTRAPARPMPRDDLIELRHYYPVTRRFMR